MTSVRCRSSIHVKPRSRPLDGQLRGKVCLPARDLSSQAIAQISALLPVLSELVKQAGVRA